MSYFAVAATRSADDWEASEVDLDGVEDLDEVIDRLREVDPAADTSLLFVEADDEYLAVIRLDGGDDARVFGSDAPFADESKLGAVLLSDIDMDAPPAVDDDGESETPVTSELDVEPVGEADLLADLGASADAVLGLCGKDGMLPADITAELAALVGCADVLEEVHDS